MENKVAVLGNADFVMPFSAMGVDTFTTDDSDEQIIENAKRILEEQYSLVVVAENIAPTAEEIFSKVRKAALPAIVVVPFTGESTGFATKSLGEVLKNATGINILQND